MTSCLPLIPLLSLLPLASTLFSLVLLSLLLCYPFLPPLLRLSLGPTPTRLLLSFSLPIVFLLLLLSSRPHFLPLSLDVPLWWRSNPQPGMNPRRSTPLRFITPHFPPMHPALQPQPPCFFALLPLFLLCHNHLLCLLLRFPSVSLIQPNPAPYFPRQTSRCSRRSAHFFHGTTLPR